MKTKFIFCLIVAIWGCDSPVENRRNTKVDSVVLKNRTSNSFLRKTKTISDKSEVNLILNQLQTLKQTGDVSLKNNKGLYEIVLLGGNKTQTVDIFFTTYDGVIVLDESTGKKYKNDDLEHVITELLK